MAMISELIISALLVIGAFFMFVGSFGLAKLPDLMRRLHGPTKSTTAGVGSVLIASMMYFLLIAGSLSLHEILIALFLFLTAPVTAHMIAKAHILEDRKLQSELPQPGPEIGWATLHPAVPAPKTAAQPKP